ncbi:MAG: T9SS type A sorting domain-containing protein [Candidatus Kapaibacterium sp.]
MKRIVTIALSVIVFGFAQTALAQFTLKTDKDTIKIYPGETAVFSIGFDIQNGYDASIKLNVVPGKPLLQYGDGTLSAYIVNFPYSDVKLMVKTTATFTKTGVYQFRIDGTNTGISSSVICYVAVVASPQTHWRIKTANNPMGGILNSVFQDTENNYWYSIPGKHLHKVSKGTPLDQWRGDDTTVYGYAGHTPIVDYKSNKLWMADHGVWSINLQSKYYTVHPVQLGYCVVLDTNTGTIWAGGRNGLARYVQGTWTIYDTTNSILRGPVLGLALSGSTVWMGTEGALVKYDGTTWTEYTIQNSGMPCYAPKVMAVESNGDVWVGLGGSWTTDNPEAENAMKGLGKFDGTSWTVYNDKNSPLNYSNIVNAVAIDKKGNKWIATAKHQTDTYDYGGVGILKFDNKEWTAYTKDNSPLPDNKINWLAVDNDDNVWFHQYLPNDYISFWGVFNENGLPFPMAPTSVEEQPIDNPDTDGSIILTPNPVSTSLSVSGIEGVTAITIVNSLGMAVMQCSMENMGSTIDVSGLPNGVYFVQFRTATGMITRPVVVSH